MKKLMILGAWICFFHAHSLYGQQCTNSYPGGNLNMSSSTFSAGWSCTGGGASFTTTGSYTESLTIGKNGAQIGGSDTFTMDFNFTLTGNISFNANGSNPIVKIPAGVTVTINGNLIDLNNNVQFNILGTLIVNGNFTANNNTAFSGSTGTISISGVLDLGANATCVGTCPHISAGSCTGSSPSFCSASVPIKLASFAAKQEGESIQLKWSTSSELNFNYFSLQKSSDGRSFSEIAKVSGHGTTNEAHNYSYEDKDPIIGRSYYRLTSNDFDGYQETFRVVPVDFQGGKRFQIYSNPSDGVSINLHFNFDTDADAMVTIYDNLGFAVGSFPAKTETIVFAPALKSGVYLAKYQSGSFTRAERFFVK